MNNLKHVVVFGGQYGSEGKASAAEYFAKEFKKNNNKLIIIGENSPNSGHTSSLGATKNIPASSFWADIIILGPDSVIDKNVLLADWEKVGKKPLYIHEHAALLNTDLKKNEQDLMNRISSTGSGSGMARKEKFIDRQSYAVVKNEKFPDGITILNSEEYKKLLFICTQHNAILECSQGALLDTNFGIFPYVTSRSTLPRVAVERNGLTNFDWTYCGVYRTYPIRTGGPSGPTEGKELTWEGIGVEKEVATVTKRIRRIFEFSTKGFCKSIELTNPDIIMFTFLDYIGVNDLNELTDFKNWLEYYNIEEIKKLKVFVSNKTGTFKEYLS